MARALVAIALLAAVAGASAEPPAGARPPSGGKRAKAGIAIGDIVWTDRELLRSEPPDKTSWKKVGEGDKLRTGDTLRTAESGVARVEFPWMAVTLGSSTMLTVPSSAVLSTVLEQGRAEFSGPGRDIVKIQVGDGEVRGGGRLVLRRSIGRTAASALEGAFRVRAAGRTVEIKAGEGTVVSDGRPPEPASPLADSPRGLRPGDDPVYVRPGQPVELRWLAAKGAQHHVELLALAGGGVLLARDTGAPPLRVEVPWVGTYRWRVFARDARGIEGRPSAEGLICAVEK
jgi:hypothetical protein